MNWDFEVDINENPMGDFLLKTSLYQNYPNPFQTATTISYSLLEYGFVELKIFDLTGQLIQTLVNHDQKEGMYKVKFSDSDLPAGVYFYQLVIDGKKSDVKKMILLD